MTIAALWKRRSQIAKLIAKLKHQQECRQFYEQMSKRVEGLRQKAVDEALKKAVDEALTTLIDKLNGAK